MTISISVAPSATAIRISSNLSLSGVCPAGNPVATLAIGICGAPAAFFGFRILILKYFEQILMVQVLIFQKLALSHFLAEAT